MRRFLYALAAIFLSWTLCCAEDGNGYLFSKVDYQSGLSHSAVLCVFQDRNGLMWFGTYDGVNCYDGREMEVYKSNAFEKTTLSNNIIHSIGQADGNNLWIDTHLGLDRFSEDSLKVTSSYSFFSDYSVCSDTSGDTWVVTRDTLWYYNTSCLDFVPLTAAAYEGGDDPFSRIFVSESGDLWYFCENSGQVNIYSVSDFSSSPDQVKEYVFTFDFHHLPVEHVFFQSGTICFTDSEDNLYLFDVQKKTKIFVQNVGNLLSSYGRIRGIVPFYDDIMLGFLNGGLVKLSASGTEPAEELDRNLRIYGLFKDDSQGILWAATDGDGAVAYARRSTIASSVKLSGLSRNLSRQVRSLNSDAEGNLWIGTKGDGLIRVPGTSDFISGGTPGNEASVYFPDRKYSIGEYRRGRDEFQVYSMCESRFHDGMWVGTGSTGLFWYSGQKDGLSEVTDKNGRKIGEIHSIHEASDSVVYVASATEGFHRLKIRKEAEGFRVVSDRRYVFYSKGSELNMFYPMVADGDSLLWLGSRGRGIVKFDKRTGEYFVISLAEILGKPVDDILSLHIASGRRLYVGTVSGLVSMDLDDISGTASYIGREHGMLNDMVHGILEDDNGYLWLSTNKGLVKCDPGKRSLHTYHYTAGVDIGEFCDDAYFRSPYSGRMFFGGIDGLLWIDSDDISDPYHIPEGIIRTLRTGGRKYTVAEKSVYRDGRRTVLLPDPPVSFSFSYSVPDYLSVGDIEYSCKLEGFDDEWSVFSNSNVASFSDVPAGDYVFTVRYKKDIFDTDYNSMSVPVYVRPHWYATGAAKAVYGAMFICLAAGACIIAGRKRRRRHAPSGRADSMEDAAPQESMTDFMTVLYGNLTSLGSERSTFQERRRALDIIREAMLKYGLPRLSESGADLAACLPSGFSVAVETDIPVFLKEVSAESAGKYRDTAPAIYGNAVFPVYRNGFGLLFHYCFSYLRKSGLESRISVSVPQDRKNMKISISSPDSSLSLLYDILSGKPEAQQENNDQETGVSVTGAFASAVAARLKVALACRKSGEDTVVEMVFEPAVLSQDVGPEKEPVLLMTGSVETGWLVSEILSGEFSVTLARTVEAAFGKLSETHFPVFIADMQIAGGGSIQDFMKLVYTHRFSVAGTKFIPMLSWGIPESAGRELLRISDAHIMLPYDIVLLKDVVMRTMFGKRSVLPVYIEELSGMGVELSCGSAEDTVFARKVLGVVDADLDKDDLGTSSISEQLAMSQSQFFRRFKKIFNTSPESFIKNYRVEKASRLMKGTSLSIAEIMADVGISSRSYFYKEFSLRFGMSPKEYMDMYSEKGGNVK